MLERCVIMNKYSFHVETEIKFGRKMEMILKRLLGMLVGSGYISVMCSNVKAPFSVKKPKKAPLELAPNQQETGRLT